MPDARRRPGSCRTAAKPPRGTFRHPEWRRGALARRYRGAASSFRPAQATAITALIGTLSALGT